HGILLTEAFDVGEGRLARARPGVLIGKRVGHGVAREGLRRDLLRARDQRRYVQTAGLVKLRDAVEIVKKIVAEPRRARNLTEADCVICHSSPLLKGSSTKSHEEIRSKIEYFVALRVTSWMNFNRRIEARRFARSLSNARLRFFRTTRSPQSLFRCRRALHPTGR